METNNWESMTFAARLKPCLQGRFGGIVNMPSFHTAYDAPLLMLTSFQSGFDHGGLAQTKNADHARFMFEPDLDYQERVQAAVVAAILRASAVDVGNGKQGAVMQPLDIAAVLTRLVAGFLAADANNESNVSKRDFRKYGDEFGKVLAKKMAQAIESGHIVQPFAWVTPPPDPSLN